MFNHVHNLLIGSRMLKIFDALSLIIILCYFTLRWLIISLPWSQEKLQKISYRYQEFDYPRSQLHPD